VIFPVKSEQSVVKQIKNTIWFDEYFKEKSLNNYLSLNGKIKQSSVNHLFTIFAA